MKCVADYPLLPLLLQVPAVQGEHWPSGDPTDPLQHVVDFGPQQSCAARTWLRQPGQQRGHAWGPDLVAAVCWGRDATEFLLFAGLGVPGPPAIWPLTSALLPHPPSGLRSLAARCLQSSREELIEDIEALKKKIGGWVMGLEGGGCVLCV